MKIKVVESATTLCATCAYGSCLKVGSDSRVRCSMFDIWMDGVVSDCTQYRYRTSQGISEMEEIAWILKTNPARTKIGFVAPGTKEHSKLRGIV